MAVADKANLAPRRAIRKWSIIAAICAPIASYLWLCICVPCGFSYSSICTDCAIMENVTEHHAPLFGFTVWTTRSQSGTRLSAVLARNGIHQGNAHHWVFCTGGDYGLTWSCALGEGRHLYDSANDPSVAFVADGLCKYADAATGDRWLNRLLDPTQARHLKVAIRLAAPPPSGFADAASFQKWWDQNVADFENAIK